MNMTQKPVAKEKRFALASMMKNNLAKCFSRQKQLGSFFLVFLTTCCAGSEHYVEKYAFTSGTDALEYSFMVGNHPDGQSYTGNTRVAYLKIGIPTGFDVWSLVTPVNRSPNESDLRLYNTLLTADQVLGSSNAPDYKCLGQALEKGRLPPVMATYNHASQNIPENDRQHALVAVETARQVLLASDKPFYPEFTELSRHDLCAELIHQLSGDGWQGVGSYCGLSVDRGASYMFYKGSEKSVQHLNHLISDLLEKNEPDSQAADQLNQMKQAILHWINSP